MATALVGCDGSHTDFADCLQHRGWTRADGLPSGLRRLPGAGYGFSLLDNRWSYTEWGLRPANTRGRAVFVRDPDGKLWGALWKVPAGRRDAVDCEFAAFPHEGP